MFEIIFLSVTGIYFLILAFLSLGLSGKLPQHDNKPSVSVIVAARNEENNIEECLNSLNNQDYDKQNYEVIIADDFSTDSTGAEIDQFICGKDNFRKITPDSAGNLRGKTNALESAVKAAKGEIILFTDADCTVLPSWIGSMVSYYNKSTGMVNSFSTVPVNNIITGMQSIDLLFLISVAGGMANNGYPVSCIGNNMSVRNDVYNATGGYKEFPDSITEDYLLLNKVKELRTFKIVFPLDESLLVSTKPQSSITELLQQKKRWALGGLAKTNLSFPLMVISYLTNLLIVISFFFYSAEILAIVLFKISAELFFLYPVHKKLNLSRNLRYFIFFEIYYITYTISLPVILLFNRKVRWKGRIY